MLTKNQIKLIKSLQTKKHRVKNGLFVAERAKVVEEILESDFVIKMIVAEASWLQNNKVPESCEVFEVNEQTMKKVSSFISPPEVIAVCEIKEEAYDYNLIKNSLSIALEQVQNPGNLGNIMRTADWFGIKNIFCTPDSADFYSPKVIQAGMGACCRIKVHYVDLEDFLSKIRADKLNVYGTFLKGQDLYKTDLDARGVILLGNEGKGISSELEAMVSKKLFIPPFPAGVSTAESLNLGNAAAVICSEFTRRLRR